MCRHCGFPLSRDSYWAKLVGDVKCPACKRLDGWQRRDLADKRVLELCLWKNLLIAEYRDRYLKGTFRLTKEFRRFKDFVLEMEARGEVGLARALKEAVCFDDATFMED